MEHSIVGNHDKRPSRVCPPSDQWSCGILSHLRSALDVPYRQNDEAKALGARWDRQEQPWFLPVTDEGLKWWLVLLPRPSALPAIRRFQATVKSPF